MITKSQITNSLKLQSNSLSLTLSAQPLSANRQITFPATAPTAGYSLISDASGNLSWSVPSLSGDVTGTTIANTVATVGGRTATSISASVADTLAATANATASTLARRDAVAGLTASGFTGINTASGWTQRNYNSVSVPTTVGSALLFATYGLPTIATNSAAIFIINIQTAGTGVIRSSKNYIITADNATATNSRCIPNYVSGNDFATNDYDLNIEITTVVNFRIVRTRGTTAMTAHVQIEYFGDATAAITTPNTTTTITPPTTAYRGALGNISFKDSNDPTKILTIDASAITTGTTRTWVLPDASDTFVGTTVVQTLSNKTLNNAVANGITFTNTSAPNITINTANNVANRFSINETTVPTAETGTVVSIGSGSSGRNAVLALVKSTVRTGVFGQTGTNVVFGNESTGAFDFRTNINTAATDILASGVSRFLVDTAGILINGFTRLSTSANVANTLTLPTSTDTLVARATVDTLSNKTINDATNTVFANGLRTANWSYVLNSGIPTSGQYLAFNGTNIAFTTPVAATAVSIVSAPGNYVLSIGETYLLSTSTTGATITLPNATTAGAGYTVTIKDGTGASGSVSTTGYTDGGSSYQLIITSASDIDDAVTKPRYIAQAYGTIRFVSDGTRWLTENPYASYGKLIRTVTGTFTIPQLTGTPVQFANSYNLSGTFSNGNLFTITNNEYFRNTSLRPQTWKISANIRYLNNMSGNDITCAICVATPSQYLARTPAGTIASDCVNNPSTSPVVINMSAVYKIEPGYGIYVLAYHNSGASQTLNSNERTSGLQIFQIE